MNEKGLEKFIKELFDIQLSDEILKKMLKKHNIRTLLYNAANDDYYYRNLKQLLNNSNLKFKTIDNYLKKNHQRNSKKILNLSCGLSYEQQQDIDFINFSTHFVNCYNYFISVFWQKEDNYYPFIKNLNENSRLIKKIICDFVHNEKQIRKLTYQDVDQKHLMFIYVAVLFVVCIKIPPSLKQYKDLYSEDHKNHYAFDYDLSEFYLDNLLYSEFCDMIKNKELKEIKFTQDDREKIQHERNYNRIENEELKNLNSPFLDELERLFLDES